MIHTHPHFYIARIVVETCSPLSIASGKTDGGADNLLVRDANDLPTIPGSSFAGVLRHLYETLYGQAETGELFGYAKQNRNEDREESPSFLGVSWGCIHTSDNKPVEGLLPIDSPIFQDPLIQNAQQAMPIRRDHVRLTHRGTAKDQGKFDRVSLTAGHRFSLELSLWSETENDKRWNEILALLDNPQFRLGGNTRRGLGQLKLVQCYTGYFDLKNPKCFQAFSKLSQKLSDVSGLKLRDTSGLDDIKSAEKQPSSSGTGSNKFSFVKKSEKQVISNYPHISVTLTPEEPYRFGGGTTSIANSENADAFPMSEQIITWEQNKGKLEDKKRVLIPASGVKGALSHRVAYHYNCLSEQFIVVGTKTDIPDENKAVKELFGYVSEEKNSAQNSKIGRLIFEDIYLKTDKVKAMDIAHNGIDRFTGGTRSHVLFFEEVVTDKQKLEFNICFIGDRKTLSEEVWESFVLALKDLTEGRLALGAGSGRSGYGYFTGSYKLHHLSIEGEQQHANVA